MKTNIPCTLFVALAALCLSGAQTAIADSFPAAIEYKETFTRILQEEDVGQWQPGSERSVKEITTNASGSRVAFIVKLAFAADRHFYVMNGDGTGLTDITSSLPAEVSTIAIRTGTLQMNDSGSRLFFEGDPGDTAGNDIYYCDVGTMTCGPAVLGLDNVSNKKVYDINRAGTRLFFRHDAGWDPMAQKHQQGLYYANVGRAPVQIIRWDQLPHDPTCTEYAYNRLYFLGSSGNGKRLLFTWDQDYCGDHAWGMWSTGLGGNPVRVARETHDRVWDTGEFNLLNIITNDGKKVLYQVEDKGNPEKLYLVDLPTKKKTLLAKTRAANGFDSLCLSAAGGYARFYAIPGYLNTRVDLATGAKRDTLSYLIPGYDPYHGDISTDLTANGRYYFHRSHVENVVHKIDTAPRNFSVVPNIRRIWFDQPALLHDGTTTVTVYAKVSDAQGLDNIEWVKMRTLVEGVEYVDWKLFNPGWSNTEPLFYNPVLYDDGTHGDKTAGDGIFTNNTLKTRGDSGFYDHYTLPQDVGIRVVAKDVDSNYVIADTNLSVAHELPPVVRIRAIDSVASEPGKNRGRFVISRTGSTGVPFFVKYAVSGTATNGVDYGTLSGRTWIPAGAFSRTLVVKPIDDVESEGGETVIATILKHKNYVVSSRKRAKIVIRDNDQQAVGGSTGN